MEQSRGYQETVDADTFLPRGEPPDRTAEARPSQQVLPRPAPTGDQGGGSSSVQMELGTAVAMDHLGPLVVGQDGKLGCIANWDKLTAREREVAVRRLTARNRERLQRLRQEQGQQEQQQ